MTVAATDAAIALLQVLVWPIVVLILAIVFRRPIAGFIERWTKANVKVSRTGLDISVQAAKSVVKAQLRNATTLKEPAPGDFVEEEGNRFGDILEQVLLEPRSISGKRALWVDDHPEWSRYEQSALEALGVQIVLSKDNSEAQFQFQHSRFDIVISHIFTDDGRPVGFELAKYLMSDNIPKIPLIFYTGHVTNELRERAGRLGVKAVTDTPTKFLRLFVSTISAR